MTMPTSDWDAVTPTKDGERYVKHQHSASSDQCSRALIPMWDSSDPERAPPPLPLNPNPQSPGFTSRPGTSSAIQSAHAALKERTRENGAVARRVGDSPERALVKGGGHRRMQSLQPSSVRDLSLMIEGSWSKPDPRPTTPTMPRELPPEPRHEYMDSENSTPVPGMSLTPILRPSARRPHQSILGENTPPQSSTMLALQSMGGKSPLREAEPALSNITNGSTPKVPCSSEHVAAQLITLTNIATSLQKEMAALTRRSRDNATDLLSLKEATKSRDEDVRKSLRELVGNIHETSSRIASFNGPYLDNKPYGSPQSQARQFPPPRIPSPKSFADSIDGASISTPSLSGMDTSASLLLLEKIWNALGTKDGQDSLVGLLNELSHKLSGMATSSKVDELADYIRSQSENAVILGNASRERRTSEQDMKLHKPATSKVIQLVERLPYGADGRRSSAPSVRGADLVSDDLMKIIRSVKDSVAQGGGLTAEVKALVRELRGEVLGMGRELGKRLETVTVGVVKGIEESEPPSKDEVSRVIDEGLEQMKEQLNNVLREHRRQSAQSQSSQKTIVDYQEIYNAMRAALRDNEASQDNMPDLSRDDVIEAVRDAWENYKPEIEVQQLGLERDEVLACLKQGLQEYAPRDERPEAATREEVFAAVMEGLKHFTPPKVDTPASLSRDEIIDAVRDCLEEFEFPVAASALGNDLSHDDVVHAVREGLGELDLPRNDALVAAPNNDEIVTRLQDIMEYMKLEFRAVSEEAKENAAAQGRDTDQVLDATKDGLENLRMAIEGYVDRVADPADHDEFLEDLSRTMDEFKDEVFKMLSQANDDSREHLHTEIEGLREIVNSSMVPAAPPAAPDASSQEILDAIHNGLTSLRQEILRPRPETSEILDAIHDGLNDISAGLDRMTNKPVDLTANDEILDAIKTGLESVRSEMESIRDNNNNSNNETAMTAVSTVDDEDLDRAMVPADMVKQEDIRNLEVLISQLQVKIEAMTPEAEPMVKQEDIRNLEVLISQLHVKIEDMTPEAEPESIHREDLTRLEDLLRSVQEGVEEVRSREPVVVAAAAAAAAAAEPTGDSGDAAEAAPNNDAATKDDVLAIETILRNTKASLDDLIEGEQAVRKEHIDAVEALVLESRETMSSMTEQLNTVSHKEDLLGLETLITQLSLTLEEMKEKSELAASAEKEETATKAGVEAVEAVALEIKTALDGLASTDFASFSNKEDVTSLATAVKEAKEQIDALGESNVKAMDDRQAEIVGVADRVTEVKTFLEEFQEAVKTKLEEGSSGVDGLSKLFEGMSEKIDKNENVGADVKEMFEAMKTQFEENKEVVAGARLESNEKLKEAADTIGTKIDDKMAELVAKYDEFKAAMEQKSDASEARGIETEAAVANTKVIAEDLKLLVDTLGSTVTDSLEKMEEASKTVFSKVEELATRSEEDSAEAKAEHEQTLEHIQQAVTAVEGLQGDMKEIQPQILEAVKDILLLVGEHFEHAKSSSTDICDKIAEVKPFDVAMLPTPEKYDDSGIKEKLDLLVESKYDDSEVKEKLDLLIESKYDDSEVKEKLDLLVESKYDDTSVQEKLDKLVDHSAASAPQVSSQLEILDKVHQAVVKTAAEISQFLSKQRQRIEDEHEDREKTLRETNLELERKLAEREHVEALLLSLRDEEERVRGSVLRLRTEHESLVRQKTRLAGDVGSLETALRLRKEELSYMEHRAESLERRIVEGVMDHSRVLLMAKSNKSGRDEMNRKRVKKPTAAAAEADGGETTPRATTPTRTSSASRKRPAVSSAALSARRNLALAAAHGGAARRIVSLSQMNSSPTSASVKRSQSVRTAAGHHAMRQGSWAGGLGKGTLGGGGGEEDKENRGIGDTGTVEEVDEPDSVAPSLAAASSTMTDYTAEDGSDLGSVVDSEGPEGREDEGSETDTLRRSSAGTTVISTSQYTESTESEAGYSEYDDMSSEYTQSAVDMSAIDETGMVVYGS
ncbi:hypothetical protein E4U42_001130 [Claviceps africana]|uniref:Transport protein USO1 n=1 Tax=Claviceps africana TaxID=83212 RepID=A0A8K0JA72_9HYPO|nr:hypothetical protein E4U42_001130 [Claviceps africana]